MSDGTYILEEGMKMRILKKGLAAGLVLCCMPMLAGCSFKETLGILWSGENSEKEAEAENGSSIDKTAVVDDRVEKPKITTDVGDPVTYSLNGEADPITVEASVEDGGTLTYQWYVNNVDSNGGGTALDGAGKASYTPSTKEAGTLYYYVVITNTVDNAIQLTTSSTKSVTVTEEAAVKTDTKKESKSQGTWRKTDKGWWYEHADGTFTKDGWEEIDGKWYAFDEDGYMRTGWFQDGDHWYYLNTDGSMAVNTKVDGYQLGEDGRMVE